MARKLLIRDVTLRDGQQSLFATRMTQAQIDRVLPLYRKAGFYAMEVWGGAVPDSIMRYLDENPWARLEKIKAEIGETCLLTALSRGRNLFGYNPYPDEVIEGFNKYAVLTGINIMRIFDALNDLDNLKSSIAFVKRYGGIADCAICYTVDPKLSTRAKVISLLHARKPLTIKVFDDEYFVGLAKKLEQMGADIITIKDMAGLITPLRTATLIKALKKEVSVPINLHTHCTPGFGLASALMAIVNGIDILDTAIMNFAGGPAAPAYELIELFCRKLNIETGVDPAVTFQINKELFLIRKDLEEFDTYKLFPRDLNISKDSLPPSIDELFELAIAYAKSDKEDDLLATCHRIERYYNFPEPDEKVRNAEIPGGMYTNMLAQLKQMKLEKHLHRTLELIPMVRLAAGCVPLVTPTSQIIGAQAVNCIADEDKGLPSYTTKSIQFVNLVKGIYGKTPVEIDPDFRYQVCGVKEETAYDTKFYKKQENPVFEEYGGLKLAGNERDELLLELFPSVASEFLKTQVETKYMNEIHRIEEEKQRQYLELRAKYENMPEEEKARRLIEGLYNYQWTSDEDMEDLGHS